MKKSNKLTALFLTGSLALCVTSTNTNTGFFSKFFNSKYGGLAIASTLTAVAALTKFYLKEEKIQGGFLSHTPFYLKALGSTITGIVKESPFFICHMASLFLGKRITTAIKKSKTVKAILTGLTLVGLFAFSFSK